MTHIEGLYLQYFKSISKGMMEDGSPFDVMNKGIVEQFDKMGLLNEEKASALVQVFTDQSNHITTEASKAALNLLKTDETNQTEVRKRQRYDDNILIEIMKAQGGLASFAVNAAAESAQDTIDDLHIIMEKVEDRVCHLVCNIPSFDKEIVTPYDTMYSGEVYGGGGLDYTISENPEKGVLAVGTDGSFTYTPQNDVDGIGLFKGIIMATDAANGLATATVLTISVETVVIT